jgi:hypothetical protein
LILCINYVVITVCGRVLMFGNDVRAFTVSGRMKPEEAVVATISSLSDEVVDTVGTVLPSEDSVSERKRKLEFLEMQEELIKVMKHVLLTNSGLYITCIFIVGQAILCSLHSAYHLV